MDKWDVSRITDMRGLFTNKNKFNQDLSKWDVSKVTAMDYMFAYATSFNQILCGEAWLKSQATKTDMFTNSAGSIAVQVCVCSAGKFLSRRGREVKCVSEVLESIPAATTTPALRIPNITMNVIRKPASLSVTTIVVIASAFVALVAFIVISITIVAWVVAKKRERFGEHCCHFMSPL